jgi:CheY-like chemotaxis protein
LSVPQNVVVFNVSSNILTLYRAVLERRGYALFVYGQDLHTLEEVAAVRPELAIVEGIIGYGSHELKLLTALRAYPPLKALPILISTTALEGWLDLHRLQALGHVFLLKQPFDYRTLLDCVRQAISAGRNFSSPLQLAGGESV